MPHVPRTTECQHPECTKQIPWFRLACPQHWFALPSNIRIDINAAWAERLKATGVERREAIDAHAAAVAAAIDFWSA